MLYATVALPENATGTYAGSTTHRIRHLLITAEGLYPKAHGLQLCPHLVELLDIAPCPDEILRHDLARILATP